MDIISLPDFVSFLNQQASADFKGDKIDRYLMSHRVEQDDFLPFIYFQEETYCRNLVYKNDIFELLLLTWLPHQRTAIHDHGGQRAWTMVQSGNLIFRRYDAVATDGAAASVALLPKGNPELKQPGDIICDRSEKSFYSIENATKKPAVSVHLYAGPVSQCRTYNEALKNFEWTELTYFSTLNG